MKQLVATVMVVVVVVLVAARSSRASSCIIPEVSEAYKQARAVFVGEVAEVIKSPDFDETSPRKHLFIITFKVEKAWKGVFTSTFDVLSSQGEGAFGFPFVRKAEKYLVYGEPFSENGAYDPVKTIISRCSRTALVSRSEKPAGIRLDRTFDRTNGAADLKILDWRYPPLRF